MTTFQIPSLSIGIVLCVVCLSQRCFVISNVGVEFGESGVEFWGSGVEF